MDPVVEVAVLVAVAIVAIALAFVWRRQVGKARRRRAEMSTLEQQIAARLADLRRGLSGSGGGPIPERAADDEVPPISEPVPVETEALSPVPLADLGPTLKKNGAGRKRRPIALGAAAVAVVAVVSVLLASRLPLNILSNTPAATLTVAAVPPSAAPSPANPTPETSPTPAATPSPEATALATTAPAVSPALTSTPTPLPSPVIYIVRLGDSMATIAVTFGVTLEDLIAANPQIRDPSLIYAGTEITIPTPTASPGASAATSAVP